LRGGGVLESSGVDESTATIQAFNRRVANESRVISTIYPAGDGMILAVRTE